MAISPTLFDLSTGTPEPREAEPREIIEILEQDAELVRRFQAVLEYDESLSRQLVSFQENKHRPCYRWYKYKEAFSASLVEKLILAYNISNGKLLDPFVGSGTALFAASELGFDADGIELLPIGQQIIDAKLAASKKLTITELKTIEFWAKEKPWEHHAKRKCLLELPITEGAYPAATRSLIERYLDLLESESPIVQQLLRFALLCVLESVSYTRKDGQYLRWDYRSKKRIGLSKFNKGKIAPFSMAVSVKIFEMVADIRTGKKLPFSHKNNENGLIHLFRGSCLEILPACKPAVYDVVFTSPPYCNRYDYTRTYALELALLGIDRVEINRLRQDMLSCTVENREKDLLKMNPDWCRALKLCDEQSLLNSILLHLEQKKLQGILNNNGIPRMVRGYFQEMACVIQECARVLKTGGLMFMVNDNVRYAGICIPVDLILSDFAEGLGFNVEKIMVLPNGKGNSSQQMGEHGRSALRKCVYVWKKY
jgi:DNA modification methylase